MGVLQRECRRGSAGAETPQGFDGESGVGYDRERKPLLPAVEFEAQEECGGQEGRIL